MATADTALPETIDDVAQLEELLSRPTPRVVEAMARIEGDLVVLGVAGKMGPTLARMAKRASDAAGVSRRVIGVSRFSSHETRKALEAQGIETIAGELLDSDFVDSLPEAPNVVFMAGMKFGSQGSLPLTWAANAYLPTLVCRKFRRSRIVAFSTGNIYGMVPGAGTGSVETDLPNPCGEYAMSCLARERMFEYFSQSLGIPTALVRLNYAVEMRYGVLADLARKIYEAQTIDLGMAYVNVIWQGDANARTLCMLPDAASPALVLNVAGPELLAVRDICARFAEWMGKPVRFTGVESPDALLSNGAAAARHYGPVTVSAERVMRWTADWIARGGLSLNKPTHFEVRDGRF
ncbi:MAG: NAD-dependent epimerase/dehydratase family protein [Pirellulales bacterium]